MAGGENGRREIKDEKQLQCVLRCSFWGEWMCDWEGWTRMDVDVNKVPLLLTVSPPTMVDGCAQYQASARCQSFGVISLDQDTSNSPL